MRARVIFPNLDRFLTPGMFAELRLPGSLPHEAILIPDMAVGTDQSETFVYIVNDESKVERRPVELGQLRHGLRIVEGGLDGNERVVVSGLQSIRPDVAVEATMTPLEITEDGDLPDEFKPIPKSEWLTIKPAPVPQDLENSPSPSE
jgi:multidrug efflux system membrane fusion protein